AEVRPGRVRRARHDLLRTAQGYDPPKDLRQGPGDGREDSARHEGAGGLLWRHTSYVGKRHLYREWHRARHRLAAAPFARRLLRDGEQPHLLPRQDHSVPRQLGGVRVRPEEHSLRPYRPQAQVPGNHLPARSWSAYRRGDPEDLLYGRHHQREGWQA